MYQNPYQNALHYSNPQQYQQTYQQPFQNQLQAQPQYSDAIYVNGINEAASWVVQRGQSVRLWDSNEKKFYIKTVGENGMPNPIEIYRYERVEAPVTSESPKVEYVTREEFEKRIGEITKPQRVKKNKEEDSDV